MINVHSGESRINQVWISETNNPFTLFLFNCSLTLRWLSFYLLFLPGGLRLWPHLLLCIHFREMLWIPVADAHIHLPLRPSQVPAWNYNLLLPLNALPFTVLSSVCFIIKPTISGKLKKGGECDSGQWWSFLTFIADKILTLSLFPFLCPYIQTSQLL